MKYTIRKIKREDCLEVAKVVSTSWNETYKEIVPDWFLNELKTNEEERARKMLDDFDTKNSNQLVLEIDGKVVGFANYGKATDEEYSHCGEIFALYIISQYKGNGLGRKLVEEATSELKKMGYNEMLISCLKGNPSNEFYKHIGGKYIKDSVFKRLNLPENTYYFDNI